MCPRGKVEAFVTAAITNTYAACTNSGKSHIALGVWPANLRAAYLGKSSCLS